MYGHGHFRQTLNLQRKGNYETETDTGIEKGSKMNNYAGFALIPGHLFMKVTQIQPTLQIAFLDPDWLKELLKENPKAIAHKKIPGGPRRQERGSHCAHRGNQGSSEVHSQAYQRREDIWRAGGIVEKDKHGTRAAGEKLNPLGSGR
jgi:hypothetical protein